MTDIALALKNLATWWKGRRGLAVLLGFCVMLMAWSLIVTSAAKASVEQSVNDDLTLRSLTVEHAGGTGITESDLRALAATEHVSEVHPWTKTGGSLTLDGGTALAVWAVPYFEAARPPLTTGTASELADTEVLLPDELEGTDLTGYVGQTLTFQFTEKTGPAQGDAFDVPLTVQGTYDATVGGIDGPSAVYVSDATANFVRAANDGTTVQQMQATIGYEKAVIVADTTPAVAAVQQDVSGDGYYVVSVASRLTALPAVISLIDMALKVLAVVTILVCAFAGMAIAASLVVGRIRQIGLLKALGFTDGRIVRVMGLELTLFGLVPGAVGVLVGVAAGALTVANGTLLESSGVPASDASIMWLPALPIAFIPVIALLAGAAWPMYRILNVMPDESMRDVRA